MSIKDRYPQEPIESRALLRTWLTENHHRCDGVWLGSRGAPMCATAPRVTCTLAAASLLTACAAEPGQDGKAPAVRLDADFSAFEAELEAFLADEDLAGATVAIAHVDVGVVLEEGYGDFDRDRVSLFASSTKVLTAGVLLRLADQGLVDLDAPISTYLSGWGDRDHDPTLAQMLSNSSGMVGLTDNPTYAPYICQYVETGTLAECGRSIYTADDAEDVVPPDTLFRYGGGQWQLAGALAEEVSGQTWDALLEDTYRAPCGAEVLGYSNPYQRSILEGGIDAAYRYPVFAHGSEADMPVTDNPNMEGGGYATAGAYGRVLAMHLQGGTCNGQQVLSQAAVDRMREDRVRAWGAVIDPVQFGGFDGYGLGWWRDSTRPGLVFDPGSFGAMPWIDQERGYAVVLLLEDEAVTAFSALERLLPLVDAAIADAVVVEE